MVRYSTAVLGLTVTVAMLSISCMPSASSFDVRGYLMDGLGEPGVVDVVRFHPAD